IGAGLDALNGAKVDGIIIGTANGGMEDCIRFLNQIVDYDEGLLTPGNFVQSTPNAIAAQVSLITHNQSYNITHMHRGLAFEMAMLDGLMKTREEPGKQFLVGAVDEISTYNHTIDLGAGWYKSEDCPNIELLQSQTAGSIAGEGAAMFLIGDKKQNAVAEVLSIKTFSVVEQLSNSLRDLLSDNNCHLSEIDTLIVGRNGDCRFESTYSDFVSKFDPSLNVLSYKHMTGEFPTANALGFWLGVQFLSGMKIPQHMCLRPVQATQPKTLLIYNTYHGKQYSLILMRSTDNQPYNKLQ
ncbi:MAG: hypothetical protein ABIV51_01290, partial [Saprospiraceae bacterium]